MAVNQFFLMFENKEKVLTQLRVFTQQYFRLTCRHLYREKVWTKVVRLDKYINYR